jgi:hypothetical protein
MTTIDLIDSFCRQSIIGIDPIDVFLTIGAQLCISVIVTSGATSKRCSTVIISSFYTVQPYNRHIRTKSTGLCVTIFNGYMKKYTVRFKEIRASVRFMCFCHHPNK